MAMQNATKGAGVTAGNAASVAVTFRVLQLASTASDPALPPHQARHMLQSVNSAAGQAAPEDLGVLAACMAETLAFQDATGCLVCADTEYKLLLEIPSPSFARNPSFLLSGLWHCTFHMRG